MGSIVISKDSKPGTGFVIDAQILRRLNHVDKREEAGRLRTVFENPAAATAADREDQRLVIEAGLVDDDLTDPAQKATQAAWLLWYTWDCHAEHAEDEGVRLATRFRTEVGESPPIPFAACCRFIPPD
jgi:hypothetical protein